MSFDEAFSAVLHHKIELGIEEVDLLQSTGRVLAEDILADRDFPPFDRATKDGIAINFSVIEKGLKKLRIEAVVSAGMPQQKLGDIKNCVEIMTGAVVPQNADTVIMYEHLDIKDGYSNISRDVKKGQDIHKKGSDVKTGTVLLKKHTKIGPSQIGVLASVGKSKILVRQLPKVCVISTGNELVDVSQIPLPHQIRKSNILSLFTALEKEGIEADRIHLQDDKESIKKELSHILEEFDVVMLSGGVSKGKFDFIPEVMESLDVRKVFHRVAQRPGKPFWFGTQTKLNTVVFSFPGNPVSTFANYHIYFLPWLNVSLGQEDKKYQVVLDDTIEIKPPLTRFIQVKTYLDEGNFHVRIIRENGSGDLTSLANSNGFICLRPRENAYEKGELVPFIASKTII
ncbi:molybdopterin biosynthesis [Maribacter sp. HTCC2170]|nr:molybdopterin biosynthesis [Maribacter sp. HTCC2170]